MPIPTERHIRDALLIELFRAGGSSRPRDIYDAVAAHFPSMTDLDKQREYENSGKNIFMNSVQWARQKLVGSGDIDNSERGLWILTDSGKRKAQNIDAQPTPAEIPVSEKFDEHFTVPGGTSPSLITLLQEHENELRDNIQNILFGMDPYYFEEICGRLLRSMGFRNVEVTKKSADGGIDGYGDLRIGIVTVHAAFQCKRWKDAVSRKSIDEFRGATQGKYDQAIFITTSRFTEGAQKESIRVGSIPIIMIDGDAIVDLMIEHGIGVSNKPLQIPILDEEYFVKRENED